MSTEPTQRSNSKPDNSLPQSSEITESPRTTSLKSIQERLKVLQANKDKWAATGIDERIAILDEIKRDLLRVTDRWVALCAEAKGIPAHTYGEVFEWSMPLTIFSLLASLRQSLEDIKKYGRPQIAGPVFIRPDGQVVAKVFPRTKFERMLGYSIEVWME
jgi:acyl-CoA reductase-like NAD-dependent aldehyde dehydrogenase